MANKKQLSEAESLKRSHSKLSNFKLTLVCLLSAVSIPVFAASLGTIGTDVLPPYIAVAILMISGILSALSLLFVSRFKR